MLFPTGEFAVFFLVAFILCWSSARIISLNKILLIILSYIFYSWWDYKFSFLLAASSFGNFSFALLIESASRQLSRKIHLIIAITFNLALLGFFKYFGFFQSSLFDLLNSIGLHREVQIFEVILPVGISFFTFQGISYVVDVYKNDIKASTSPVDILLYNSFFPHLVAGPIVRAKDFLPQLAQRINYREIYASRAFLLIGIGLFKKVVLAHSLAVEVVGPVFESPKSFATPDLLLGMYGYAFQIYFDFSAYSDMAIGIAYLLGFEFKRNFNQPYRALSLSDFWRRWHISLSTFLRDYLYIPLGGSRKSHFFTYRNLMITMTLGGLWHGASWNFVIWGVIHGFGLIIEKEFARRNFVIPTVGIWGGVRTMLTFHYVCLAWVFFNADSLPIALEYLVSMLNFDYKTKILNTFTLVILMIAVFSQFVPEDLTHRLERFTVNLPVFFQGAMLGYFVVTISALSPGVLAPFIYFKF